MSVLIQYIFQKEESGEYRIGTNTDQQCNAIGDCTKCPKILSFDAHVDIDNTHFPVTIIGKHAFDFCGQFGQTRTVIIPKEIKVIREYGVGNMDFVSSLQFESGSQLEKIEAKGFDGFGSRLQKDVTQTLVLPSSLKKTYTDSFYASPLFSKIVYCGSASLTAKCSVGMSFEAVVSYKYQADSLFGAKIKYDLSGEPFGCQGCQMNTIKNSCNLKLLLSIFMSLSYT